MSRAWRLPALALAALAPAIASIAVIAPAQAADRIDGVAAVVDDQVILYSEVAHTAAPVLQRLERQQGRVPADTLRQVMSESLQSLIDERLILDMAKRMQIETTPEEIDREVARIAEEEGLSVDQVYVAAAEQGLPREEYRKRLGELITRMRVLSSAVRSRVSVTDQEVRKLYEERYSGIEPGVRVRARHILVPWPATEEERSQARSFVAELRERVLAGADFGELASQYSRAPSAANGGLSMFREGELAPELAGFVFGAQPGDLSLPIETEYGLNLILVLDRFDPSQVTFEQVRDRLRAELTERKSRPELERWVRDLRKNRYIEVVAPELR